jgi:hypothetical protein
MGLLDLPLSIERRPSDFLELDLKAFRTMVSEGEVAWTLPVR